jgi:hypothetical protein
MRKAFDANIPKLKPRLKGSAPVTTLPLEDQVDEAPHAVRVPFAGVTAAAAEAALVAPSQPVVSAPVAAPTASATVTPALTVATPTAVSSPAPTAAQAPPTVAAKLAAAVAAAPAVAEQDDVSARRARLDKIKAKVAEHARPALRAEPSPADPARAAERVLGLARDLELELDRSREREEALRAELDAARADGARAAAEARQSGEALATATTALEEKRTVLGDLLTEMNALEAERDEALRRAQAVTALDEERARLLEDLSRRVDDEARGRGVAELEVGRLTEELRDAATDGARLRAALAELARERDQLAGELLSLKRDREDLDAAKRALEQVHTALSQARARIG